jgi:DNA-binding NarL/FixJ family response regulator
VLIADDHPLFRQALALAVGGAAHRPHRRGRNAGRRRPRRCRGADLALIMLDLKMPGAVGYSGIALLHAEPDVPILVISSAEGAAARRKRAPSAPSVSSRKTATFRRSRPPSPA